MARMKLLREKKEGEEDSAETGGIVLSAGERYSPVTWKSREEEVLSSSLFRADTQIIIGEAYGTLYAGMRFLCGAVATLAATIPWITTI